MRAVTRQPRSGQPRAGRHAPPPAVALAHLHPQAANPPRRQAPTARAEARATTPPDGDREEWRATRARRHKVSVSDKEGLGGTSGWHTPGGDADQRRLDLTASGVALCCDATLDS